MEDVLRDLVGTAYVDALQGYYTLVFDASAPLVRCNFLAPDGRRAFWVGYRRWTPSGGGIIHWYVNGLVVPAAWVHSLIQAAHQGWEAGLLA